jgi:hypothetical protein
MRMGFDFKGEFHQFGIYTVSATFGINRPFFKNHKKGWRRLPLAEKTVRFGATHDGLYQSSPTYDACR